MQRIQQQLHEWWTVVEDVVSGVVYRSVYRSHSVGFSGH